MAAVLVLAALAAASLFHELGHWIAARLLRFPVPVVSLGLGPPVFRFRRGDTEVRIGPLPFGGYVRVPDLEPGSESPRRFALRNTLRRLAVVAAGPAVGVLAAGFLAAAALALEGVETGRLEALEVVATDGPVREAGLHPGDRIEAVEGRVLDRRDPIGGALRDAPPTLRLTVRRGGERWEVPVRVDRSGERPRLGGRYLVHPERRGADAAAVLLEIVRWPVTRAGVVLGRAADWVRPGREVRPVGPVGLADRVAAVSAWTAPRALRLGALLFLVVGLFNLLPFPGLDGGRLVIEGVESIRRRRLSPGVAVAVQVAGTVLLLGAWVAIGVLDLTSS